MNKDVATEYTTEYYSATKKKEILPLVTAEKDQP